MATDHNFRIKNGLEVGGQLIVNSSGQLVVANVTSNLKFNDSVRADFGNGTDLRIVHNGTNSFIENHNGDLKLIQYADDKDIVFQSDNGSGGTATYFLLDGSTAKTQFNRHLKIIDNMQIQVGTNPDMLLYHDSQNSYIKNDTGDLIIDAANDITIDADGGDIRLKDGGTQFGRLASFLGSLVITSGATDTAMIIGNTDGSMIMGGNVNMGDNKRLRLGDGPDLQIYHNGSNSYIDDSGTGNLFIRSNEIRLNKYTGEFMLRAIADGAVTLYYDNSAKLATTSSGIDVTGTVTSDGLSVASDTDTISTLGRAKIGAFVSDYAYFSHFDNATSTNYALNQNSTGATSVNAKAGASVGLKINNVNALTVASNSNVGINTTNPLKQLHIHMPSGQSGFLLSRNNALTSVNLQLGVDSSKVRLDAYGDMAFFTAPTGSGTNASEKMRINTSGNVGIGTQTPQGKLDVDGDLRVTRNIVSNTVYQMLSLGSDRTVDDYGGLNKDYWRINLATPGASTDGGASAHAYGTLIFSGVTGVNTTYADRMAITAGGNVGINDNVPSKGKIQINQQSNTLAAIQLTNSAQTSSNHATYPISIFFGDEQVGSSARHQASINAVREAWSNSPAALTFKTSATVNGATEKMRITSAGNVGIGLTGPSARLHVQGTTTDNSAEAFRASDSSGTTLLRVRNDGVVLIEDNYLYVTSNAGAYFDNSIKARGGIHNDQGDLLLNDNVNVTGQLQVYNGSSTNRIRLYTETGTAQIADTFSDTTTQKSYIYFDAGVSSNDPGYIMHETSDSETNEGVLHLVPSDDNDASDYVSIHGTNDADCLRLRTNGKIDTAGSHQLVLLSGNGDVLIDDGLTVSGNLTVNGTTTTLNTATLNVEDKNIILNQGSGDTSSSADGAGITIQDAVNSSTDATILWDATNDEFDFSHPIKISGSLGVTNIVTNKVVKFNGSVLDDSNITDTGSAITLGSATSVSGGALTLENRGYAVDNAYYTWRRVYSVSTSSTKEILDRDGNSLDTAGVYTFSAHIPGTSVNGGTRAVFWNVDGTWRYNVTSQSGNSSNHPEFIIDATSNKPTIRFDHSSTYNVHVYHEWMRLGEEQSGQDNHQASVGADGYMSSVNGVLRYEPDGISDTGVDQWDEGYTIWHSNNAQQFTTTLKNKLDGIESNATADQTAADIRGLGFFDTSNDGSGSGLDADTLDGNHASAFLTSGTTSLSNYLRKNANDTFTGALTIDSGTSMGLRIEHDTFGQGLELHREDNTNAASIKFSNNSGTSGILFAIHSETDLYWRKGTGTTNHRLWHSGNDGSGTGLDADKLDGVQGSSFLRSDATDTASGNLTFSGTSTFSGHTFFTGDIGNSTTTLDCVKIGTSSSGDPQIQLTGDGVNAHIDFSNASGQDYDVRIINNASNQLDFQGIASTGLKSAGNTVWHAGNDGSGSGLDADTLDGINSGSFLRSDAGDTSSATYYFSRTSTTPVFDIGGHAGASSYNYFLRAGNDTYSTAAVHFVNGSTRTADHGANAYVIRNDNGKFVLGKTSQSTKIYGSGDLTYNDNEVWHAGNDGPGSGLNADLLDGIGGDGYLRSNANDTYTGTLSVAGTIQDSGDSRRIHYMYGTTNSQPAFGLGEQGTYGMKMRWDSSTNIEFDGFWNTSVTGSRNRDLGDINVNTAIWSFPTGVRINGSTAWHAGNDGSGSGLDADTVDGVQASALTRTTATTTQNMNNFDITGVNRLTFNDPGVTEGIKWDGGNLWQIYESPDNQTNASGNLQFTSGSGNGTIRMTLDTSGGLNVTGALTATSKSFDIEHPTKEGMRLHHGVLEGPEHAVYIRGKSNSYIIELPDYWEGLVHEDTITVQLTPIGGQNNIWVENIEDNKVYIDCEREMKQYFYFIQAERKDVERFEVEYDDIVQ